MAVENQNGGIFSSNYLQSSEEEKVEASVVGISQSNKVKEGNGHIPHHEEAPSKSYINELLKDEKYETVVTPDTLPTYLASRTGKSSLKVDHQDDMSESSTQEATDEVDIVESEGEKSPPLAGSNVMNIILVAAECAPWIKTGNLAFIISRSGFPYWINLADLYYD